MKTSIIENLKENAETYGEKTAIIADDATLTYSELFDRILCWAEFLKNLGIGKQDRVLIQGISSVGFVISVLAVHYLNAISVPIEKRLVEGELAEKKQITGANFCISSQEINDKDLCWIDMNMALQIPIDNIPAYESPDENSCADLIFTSGTTGKPKSVLITHKELAAGVDNIIDGFWNYDDLIYLLYGPLNHIFTLRRLYALLVSGYTVVMQDGLSDIGEFFNKLDLYKVNATHMHPTAIKMLLGLAKKQLRNLADQFVLIETGTAPLSEKDKMNMLETFPNVDLTIGYGATEADAIARYRYSEYPNLAGCVGKATCHAEIFIVDENDQIIDSSPGCTGRIACRGGMIMEGYYNNPAETANVLHDGIFFTSDLGYIDSDGFLFVLGRTDDVINSGGVKVSAREIEEIGNKIKGINECACIGVDDDNLGQAAMFIYTTEPTATLSEKDLRKLFVERLENYKAPKYYREVSELPKTSSGKINKNKLKELFDDGH